MAEREVIEVHYQPDAPESVDAREALQPVLLMLARAKDRGGVDASDNLLFNHELREVTSAVQDDPFLAVRYTAELLLAVDRAAGFLAHAPGMTNEAAVRWLLPA